MRLKQIKINARILLDGSLCLGQSRALYDDLTQKNLG